ncbi:MAG TPA: hypothetical protein VHY08_06915 [Bacillota bacterium]|nr:hypothetical protein [Bacillota bacterium]
MNRQESSFDQLSVQLGFWSATICTMTFILWTFCFIGILVFNPLFRWTNLENYISYTQHNNQFLKTLAETAMVIFGVAFVTLLNSIHSYAPQKQKLLTRISLCFGSIFVALTGMSYFIQVTTVRLDIIKGQTVGLEQFINMNPQAAIMAVNLLGWSLFLGLASLFAAPVFTGPGLKRVIRYSLMINGILCLIGGIGFAFDQALITGFCMYFGMGAATLVATWSLAIFFNKTRKLVGSNSTQYDIRD